MVGRLAILASDARELFVVGLGSAGRALSGGWEPLILGELFVLRMGLSGS
jgi:hypothetical protein